MPGHPLPVPERDFPAALLIAILKRFTFGLSKACPPRRAAETVWERHHGEAGRDALSIRSPRTAFRLTPEQGRNPRSRPTASPSTSCGRCSRSGRQGMWPPSECRRSPMVSLGVRSRPSSARDSVFSLRADRAVAWSAAGKSGVALSYFRREPVREPTSRATGLRLRKSLSSAQTLRRQARSARSGLTEPVVRLIRARRNVETARARGDHYVSMAASATSPMARWAEVLLIYAKTDNTKGRRAFGVIVRE